METDGTDVTVETIASGTVHVVTDLDGTVVTARCIIVVIIMIIMNKN